MLPKALSLADPLWALPSAAPPPSSGGSAPPRRPQSHGLRTRRAPQGPDLNLASSRRRSASARSGPCEDNWARTGLNGNLPEYARVPPGSGLSPAPRRRTPSGLPSPRTAQAHAAGPASSAPHRAGARRPADILGPALRRRTPPGRHPRPRILSPALRRDRARASRSVTSGRTQLGEPWGSPACCTPTVLPGAP